jgi:3-deoxy-D-arabino-heptulosonate 7-phosphate (DAHP) synthase class II
MTNEKEYTKLYSRIERQINFCSECGITDAEAYRTIKDLFNSLESLKWKAPERTDVLRTTFRRTFTKEWLRDELSKTGSYDIQKERRAI